ncbi:MAG: cytochrome c3 family protein, partial [Xanthomonadales bacterium]|nr:cytochrome c3 family protein [Xanthomonadales bacterium]
MKRLSFWTAENLKPLFVLLVTISILMIGASEALAYEDYSDCQGCHGGFRSSPYISLSDGVSWGDDLHDVHRRTMLNSDCDVCHNNDFSPVFMDSSNGGDGLRPISCAGCHGRQEDIGNNSGSGAGLRQHHTNAGELDCMDCHDDADPDLYTPVGEDVLPEYY